MPDIVNGIGCVFDAELAATRLVRRAYHGQPEQRHIPLHPTAHIREFVGGNFVSVFEGKLVPYDPARPVAGILETAGEGAQGNVLAFVTVRGILVARVAGGHESQVGRPVFVCTIRGLHTLTMDPQDGAPPIGTLLLMETPEVGHIGIVGVGAGARPFQDPHTLR